jgi:hypothetical protein
MRLAISPAKVKDGIVFKCSRLNHPEIKISIREGTIFDGSHLTLMESIRIIFYFFARGFNGLQTFRDLREFSLPHLQYQYVADMYRRVRHLIHV